MGAGEEGCGYVCPGACVSPLASGGVSCAVCGAGGWGGEKGDASQSACDSRTPPPLHPSGGEAPRISLAAITCAAPLLAVGFVSMSVLCLVCMFGCTCTE